MTNFAPETEIIRKKDWIERDNKMSFRFLRVCLLIMAVAGGQTDTHAQRFAGFVNDAKYASTDSLMNVGGMEYYLLYENYETVHFLSLLSERRETFIIGPACPEDTLYQDGYICGKLGVEEVRTPLDSLKNDSMLVNNKYPSLFQRCEAVSPCNFKACDTNNFGYKIVVDFPSQEGAQWDYLRFWMINFIDTITNMDLIFYDDVFLEKNIDKSMLPTEVIRRNHPEAFEIEDISNGQAIVDHFRDMYMRQVYYLKNLDFSFPLSYLRIFISPRYVSDRYVTLFVATNLYAYGAHDFPVERYVTFDMKRMEIVKNKNLFQNATLADVRKALEEEMAKSGMEMGDAEIPQAAIYDNYLVFSFQPYQVGTFADGISHFKINKDKLKKCIAKNKWW